MADVIAQSRRRDAVSKRHHYVPKGYLKAWSPDGKRVEVVDTVTGTQKFQGLGDTCVKENFYQLFDADGAHNQAEKMMSVLDDELVRVVRILLALQPGDDLSFEDFMSFGHMITLQRTRTPQTRRLMSAWGDWIAQQTWRPGTRPFTATSPVWHLSSLFDAMVGGRRQHDDPDAGGLGRAEGPVHYMRFPGAGSAPHDRDQARPHGRTTHLVAHQPDAGRLLLTPHYRGEGDVHAGHDPRR
jgi:hypothetical protein